MSFTILLAVEVARLVEHQTKDDDNYGLLMAKWYFPCEGPIVFLCSDLPDSVNVSENGIDIFSSLQKFIFPPRTSAFVWKAF